MYSGGHGGNRAYDLWNTSPMLKPARCGYTLRVTSQASYSPEYITPRQKISDYCLLKIIQEF